ncbi:unnamed protein product, partial [Discosporangium mesarthrocarpum]
GKLDSPKGAVIHPGFPRGDTEYSTMRVDVVSFNPLYLRHNLTFPAKNVFLLILGLRVFGVGTRTPFTGGAEALRGAAETLLTDRKDG